MRQRELRSVLVSALNQRKRDLIPIPVDDGENTVRQLH
jgi:hypothetical protein